MLVRSKCFLIIFLVGTLFVGGCMPAADAKAGITIAGSTSVQPFAELLAEEFMNLHPEVTINVQGGGSSAGIRATCSGAADIGLSSRGLTGEEKKLWEIEIARDGVALIVHPSNPVRDLTLNQIREIYAGRVKKWSQVNSPDWNIHVVTREEGSGTRSAFEEQVMGDERITTTAIVQDSNGAVRVVVAGDRAAIGFISLGLVNEKVKAIAIDGVAATRDNVINQRYKLSRPFLFVTREQPVGEAQQFIDFVMSAEGQKLLASEGLVTTSGGSK